MLNVQQDGIAQVVVLYLPCSRLWREEAFENKKGINAEVTILDESDYRDYTTVLKKECSGEWIWFIC